jgi:hypothetical protein
MVEGQENLCISLNLAVANNETRISFYLPLDKNAITEAKLLTVFPILNAPPSPLRFFVRSAKLGLQAFQNFGFKKALQRFKKLSSFHSPHSWVI